MTTSDLARTGNRTQAIEQARPALTLEMVTEMTGYSLADIAMIRHNMAASMGKSIDDVPFYDIALYCRATKKLELDPLLRQTHWIAREGKGSLQIGIDGFRAIADRSGTYAGSEPAVFRGLLETTYEGKTISAPETATVVVWKIVAGHKCAFTGEARWTEFYPGNVKQGFMWRKMPYHMLAKCAEGQALRKAFPAQLGTVEMAADLGEGALIEDASEPRRSVVVQEQRQQQRPSERPEATAADYDRVFRGEEAQPGPEDSQPEGSAEADDKLKVNAELLATAHDLGVRGLGPLKAAASWSAEKIEQANAELNARIKSRDSELDAQASAESSGQAKAL